MKFGLKGAAVFAALGVASFSAAPDASANVPMDGGTMMTARAAEIISDVYGENDARVITVRMPDGEQFVIRDWSASAGPVRRVTERDFDKDGDVELRIAYRDGSVVEVEDVDVDFGSANSDAMALLGDEGTVIWNNEIAGRLGKETEGTDVNSYRSSSRGSDSASHTSMAPVQRTSAMTQGDMNESDSVSSHGMSSDSLSSNDVSSSGSESSSIRLDADGDVIWDRDMGHSSGMSSATTYGSLGTSGGDVSSMKETEKETEFLSGSVDGEVHMSDVNSYRSSSSVNSYSSSPSPSAVDRTYVLTEGETSVSRTNSWTPSSVDLSDPSVVGEVADKVEDAGDMSVSGLNEVGDKSEDAWDMTKRGAGEVGDKLEDAKDQSSGIVNEVADKVEDAKDESVKLSKKRNVVTRGASEIGDKLEDVKDFFTGDDSDEDDR